MTVKIEQLPGEPIILITYFNPFVTGDLQTLRDPGLEIVANVSGTFYAIHDASELVLTYADAVLGMATATRIVTRVKDIRRMKTLLVGTSDMVKFVAKSLSQIQYGGLDLELFDTLEEAMEYARGQAADDRQTD